MFRVSQFMREVKDPTPVRPQRAMPGPVVIWNLIRRCNLTCKHCYSISGDVDFPGELSTGEVLRVMDDLWASGVRVLILSGGEPLMRRDIFEISSHAKQKGFYVGLSSNGTLIDAPMARRIAETGYNYVGVSLDGMQETHDRFRRKQGAFEASLAGIRHCRDVGVKVGLRFTVTKDNVHDLPELMNLMKAEAADKLYVSHLNYAGRGNKNRGDDAHHKMTRAVMDLIFSAAWADVEAGGSHEYVSGNNDADAVYFLHWVERHHPHRAHHLRQKLEQWGGNSSGVNIANIDNLGIVHPDTMWWHYPLGSIKERSFNDIWNDLSDPLMAGLKMRPRPVEGRCGACQHLAICGGNTRVRAQQLTGNPWAEDPACYLDDAEIGVSGLSPRLEVTPFRGVRRQPRPAAE